MTCPKFNTCNAPICPFDLEHEKRSYLKGEPICVFMLEYMKPGGPEKLRGIIGAKGAKTVGRLTREAEKRWKPLYRRLQRASHTNPRLGGAP